MNTIGVDLKSLTLQVEDQAVRLQIWDTQGQEQFFSLTRSYFRNCQGAVIVFDLTNQQSLQSIGKYVDIFKQECPPEACENLVLVGAKADDVENRVVTHEDALNICKQFNFISYFECSAQTGENVDEAFFSIASKAFQRTQMMEEQNNYNSS